MIFLVYVDIQALNQMYKVLVFAMMPEKDWKKWPIILILRDYFIPRHQLIAMVYEHAEEALRK